MSASHGAPPQPDGAGTERCGNFDACGGLSARHTAGLCGGCRHAVYCDAACQRAAWAAHKAICKEIQRRNTNAASEVPKLAGAALPFGPTLAAARAGDAAAQFNVGALYTTGTSVAQSWSSAFEWYTRCAAHPAPPREVWAALGDCYRIGHGVAADAAEAVRLFRMGADAGDADAQFRLACCLEAGVGVPAPDVAAAAALYAAAAAQDDPDAIVNLGCCYSAGRGVLRDVPRAVSLYKRVLAHPQADPSAVAMAAHNLGGIHWNGNGVPADRALAARYWRQAAALGNETATRLLREVGLA